MHQRPFLYLFFFLSILFAGTPFLIAALNPAESSAMNNEIGQIRKILRQKYEQVADASEEEQSLLIEQIKECKVLLWRLENEWRENFAKEGCFQEEGCGVWDPGELTLSQLVMEYGSVDFLYIIPPEIMNNKIQIFSGIPLPRSCWDSMIKLLLQAHGIGVKQISSYAKKLYLIKQDLSMLEALCTNRENLEQVESGARIGYIFTPPTEQIKALQNFFSRFSDPKETSVQVVGNKIVLVSSKENIEKLWSLYDVIWEKNTEKVVRVISMQKIEVSQAEKILKAFFPDPGYKGKIPIHSHLSDELVFITIPQGIVLVGNQHAITRAESVLQDLESQLEDPYEMTVYWYSCKHSNPEDIAEVLSQVYESLLQTDNAKPLTTSNSLEKKLAFVQQNKSVNRVKNSTFAIEGNFIVDPKTGSILMVIRKDQIPKIKGLLQKIDVPKKMVQIDVLLVEKRLQDHEQLGVNLLKIGSNVMRNDWYGAFDASKKGGGLLDFVFAKTKEEGKSSIGLDFTYNFLMTQKDLKINANPSVLAVNQTSASIAIVEEISLNSGAVILDSAASNPRSERSFTRAQYGTVLKMTPTIHSCEEDEKGFITLVTDITFDTTQRSSDNRPPVTKRSIKNEVTVADGETIILGGLRQMNSEITEEKIPYLGDIPGLGKLFSMRSTNRYNKEMFIFITPKIIQNGVADLRKIREKELQKRAGDLPEFLAKIAEAKERERQQLLESKIDWLFSKAA